MTVASHLKQPTRKARGPRVNRLRDRPSLFGLAPSGVCHAVSVTRNAVRSYRTVSPLPALADIGGLLSVALSVDSRPPGVTWRSALWSPDFPPLIFTSSDCSANSAADCTRLLRASSMRVLRTRYARVSSPAANRPADSTVGSTLRQQPLRCVRPVSLPWRTTPCAARR